MWCRSSVGILLVLIHFFYGSTISQDLESPPDSADPIRIIRDVGDLLHQQFVYEDIQEYAYQQLVYKDTSYVTDLEVLARISDYVARRTESHLTYHTIMAKVILGRGVGIEPLFYSILTGEKCRGLGRDPSDCPANLTKHWFEDTGFHPDYQDFHNQPYHFWTVVAGMVRTDDLQMDLERQYNILYFGMQIYHEGFQGSQGDNGASVPDVLLSEKGFELGRLVAEERIAPEEIGTWLRRELSRPFHDDDFRLFIIDDYYSMPDAVAAGLLHLNNIQEAWYGKSGSGE